MVNIQTILPLEDYDEVKEGTGIKILTLNKLLIRLLVFTKFKNLKLAITTEPKILYLNLHKKAVNIVRHETDFIVKHNECLAECFPMNVFQI